jgi:DNA-3-methyladenine glycosylase
MESTTNPKQAALPRPFFSKPAPDVAQALLGCVLVHDTDAGTAAGRIVETEAYDQTDAASHSARGRTPRNAAMFGPGGYAYVYRSYGIHWCMNVSCGPDGFGAAVLLRALEPLEGLVLMARRRNLAEVLPLQLCRGPGNLTQAMGIAGLHNGVDLLAGPLRLTRGAAVEAQRVWVGPRIGITKAAEVPWRFAIGDSPYVSGKRLISPASRRA